MESASSIFWGLLIVVALVVVNAFFVAAEYALVRVRRTRMEALAAQGSGLARVVLHGLDHLSRYIAGVQVGITLAGLASGRFGEPVLAALFDPLFAQLFPPSLLGTEVRRLAKITWPFPRSTCYDQLYAEPNDTSHRSEVYHPEAAPG